jgi:hypothetical protein
MKIVSCERIPAPELLARLRRTRLIGNGAAAVYGGAELELAVSLDPSDLAPAQAYVLSAQVQTVLALREALREWDADPFALTGALVVRTAGDPDTEIPVLPPIVEESREPDGRTVLLVADGLHRTFAARSLGLALNAVIVRGLPRELPYYALATDGGWDGVRLLEALPDGFLKKVYRVPGNYRALFRDYNAQFPGMQERRAPSNPEHVRP